MENNEEIGKLLSGGSNTELEKFKRRLIRAVARKLIHEKINENEVWVGLKKETGCDCQEIWRRMHALTIKKLDRLTTAQDRIDSLPKAARMSITDWLMFDTVLVHEDFDVIGMHETTSEDKQFLEDLYHLVEKHTIEFVAGDDLTEAWLKVTLEYNRKDRQCSPMLLQRRWYQMKLATRAKFYKYWSLYKGIAKRQHLAEAYKPTKLQTTIALRYKTLVVTSFMLWEDLIKNKLVILPEEFERKGNADPAKSIEICPDVMCVEPVVETINLDSDSDLEHRKEIQNDNHVAVAIKQEPRDTEAIDFDENSPYENRHEKILHVAEAVMEATAMELDEIELADDINDFITHPGGESDYYLNEYSDKRKTNPNRDKIIGVPSQDVENNACEIQEAAITTIPENESFTLVTEEHFNTPVTINKYGTEYITEGAMNEVEVEDSARIGNNDTEVQKEPEPILPKITSIFGGVDISTETLSKISLLASQTTNCINILGNKTKSNVADANSIVLSSVSSNDLTHIDNTHLGNAHTTESANKINCDVAVPPEINRNGWFGDLSNDINFTDDGIQLVDDGIVYTDDESASEMPEIKTEIDIEQQSPSLKKAKEKGIPQIDEKLLMLPVVKILKLDDMGILPIHLLSHINSKCLIDVITSKNNSFTNKLHLSTVKKERDVSSSPLHTAIEASFLTGKETYESDSNHEAETDVIKRVKLTSNLLQKPRSRTYNPIQLCKNPDFNTRLKKLSVGFFSSVRNRSLVKACKPLSIDVSKAFEHKLVNGTMYLEMNSNEEIHKYPEQTCQNVSVLPSAMIAQSLIDNTKSYTPPVSCSPITAKSTESSSPTCERNKVINLPDISEIRRINQKLLTAEVTPLQVQGEVTSVPVKLVTTLQKGSSQNIYNKFGEVIAGPASKTKLMHPQIVDITKEGNISEDRSQASVSVLVGSKDNLKSYPKTWSNPWKPKLKPEVPWFSSKNNIYADDTLLALDSLNKMLYLLTEDEIRLTANTKGNKKKKKNAVRKNTTSTLNDDDNDDVQVVSETKITDTEAKKSRKGQVANEIKLVDSENKRGRKGKTEPSSLDKKSKQFYCCWARERICHLIFSKKQRSKHNCPFPLCLCCCRNALLKLIRKKELPTDIKTTSAIPLDNITSELNETGTKDVTFVKENKVSDDVAEIIPIEKKTTNKDSVIDPSSSKEVQTADNTVISCKESTQEVVRQIIDDTSSNSSSVTIGAEVSVITSESPITLQDSEYPVTIDLEANTTTNVTLKPRIIVKSAKKSRTEARRRRNVIQAQCSVIHQPRQLVLAEENLATVRKSMTANNSLTQKMPKTGWNQKMIYINSKQISKLPSDNPIFLGKNKILLTTAKFPSNFKAFETVQATLKETLALPKGIQLVLLPSGRITYVRDCNPDVSEEFMASLTELIAAIQEQINSNVAQPSQTEVIDLSYDETPDVVETTEKQSEDGPSNNSNISETNSPEKFQTENTVETCTSEMSAVNAEKTIENANEDVQSNLKASESDETNVPTRESGKFKNILSDLMAMSGIEPTDVTPSPKVTDAVISAVEEIDSQKITECEKLPTQSILLDMLCKGTNRGTLLSSSISPFSQPNISILDQNCSIASYMHVPMTTDDRNINKTEVSINQISTKSFTAITSLSELKYACTQNGIFFKLDLETGLLMPINVCMKKFTESSERAKNYDPKLSKVREMKSKSVIDLTDDDVSEATDVAEIQFNSDEIALSGVIDLEEDVNTYNDLNTNYDVIATNSASGSTNDRIIDPRIDGSNITKDGNVKPLKLFKTSVLPNSLQQKLKEIQKRIVDARIAEDLARRKLKRNQEFKFQNSNVGNNEVLSDSSSDEEPLSKVAKKMRAAEKATIEKIRNVSENSEVKPDLPVHKEVKLTNEMTDAIDDITPNIDRQEKDEEMPIQCLDEPILNEDERDKELHVQCLDETILNENHPDEEMPIQFLDETLLNEDESAEDCILGV